MDLHLHLDSVKQRYLYDERADALKNISWNWWIQDQADGIPALDNAANVREFSPEITGGGELGPH